jgi:hypothetical protein
METQCAQVGPRGGWCKRTAQVANGWPLDFCATHNQMVRNGVVLMCRKCGGVAATATAS